MKKHRWTGTRTAVGEPNAVPCDTCGVDLRGKSHLESYYYRADACSKECAGKIEAQHREPVRITPVTANGPFDTQLTRQEVNVLLRAIASHTGRADTEQEDRSCGGWLARRLLRLLPETEELGLAIGERDEKKSGLR